MIWIVSKNLVESIDELNKRHQYIETVSGAKVSPWRESKCKDFLNKHDVVEYYQCKSKKGEYGMIITAHILDVLSILYAELTIKPAIVVINSCIISDKAIESFRLIVGKKNKNTELLFAKQEAKSDDILVNYYENVGGFGFSTTKSERELYQLREYGLIKAVRKAYIRDKQL